MHLPKREQNTPSTLTASYFEKRNLALCVGDAETIKASACKTDAWYVWVPNDSCYLFCSVVRASAVEWQWGLFEDASQFGHFGWILSFIQVRFICRQQIWLGICILAIWLTVHGYFGYGWKLLTSFRCGLIHRVRPANLPATAL